MHLPERGLPPLVATQLHALSGPSSSGVQSFVRTEVGKVEASDAFAEAWLTANRAVHQALVAALTGQTGAGITVANDTVSINLGPFIQVVKQRLTERGFDLASRIPDVSPSFTILQSDAITKARGAFNPVNAIGNWSPLVVMVLLAPGVYVAKDHRRALVGAGLRLAGGMLALALGIAIFRTIYLNGIPAEVVPHGRRGRLIRHPRTIPQARAAYGGPLVSDASPAASITAHQLTSSRHDPDPVVLAIREGDEVTDDAVVTAVLRCWRLG